MMPFPRILPPAAALFLLLAAISAPLASAFLPHPSPRAALRPDQPPLSSTSLSVSRAPRGVPTLEEWIMMRDGGVKVRVFGHPDAVIDVMEIISTSTIEKSGGIDLGMCRSSHGPCLPLGLRSPLAARTPGGIDGNQVGAVSPATSLTIVSEMTGTCAANMMLGRGYPLAFFCGVPIFIYDRN